MKKTLFQLGLSLSLAVFANLANAVIVSETFMFKGQGNASGQALNYSQSGLTLDVTAGYFNGSSWYTSNLSNAVSQDNSYGLGARGQSSDGNPGRIDGSGLDDGLKFTFNQEVKLSSIQKWWNGSSKAKIEYFKNNNWYTITSSDYSNYSCTEYSGACNKKSNMFRVSAGKSSSKFTIKMLTVEYHKNTPPPVTVSEPATIALVGLGVLGLAYTRRQKSQA